MVAEPRAMAREDVAARSLLLSLSTWERDFIHNVDLTFFVQFAQEFLAVVAPVAVPVTITGGK